MSNKLIISWDEYNKIVEELALKVHNSGFKVDLLIGIMRGGAPIIDVLSRIFKIKCAYMAVESYSGEEIEDQQGDICLLYTSPSPRDLRASRMPSSA